MASPARRGAASIAAAPRSCASSPRWTASKRIDCRGCRAARSACRFGPCTPRATNPTRPWLALRTSTSRLVSRQARACSTNPGSPEILTALLVVAEGPQRGLVVRPALAHAHPGLQEHLRIEQPLHLLPRAGADLAQALAALADHDRLLPLALDPDHRADAHQPGLLLVALDLHRGRVGQFL